MSARTGLAKVLRRAAIGPLNLGILGGAVVGAVALASWPIAAIGGAAYAALVATDVTSSKFRRRVLLGREAPRRLDPRTVQDETVRAAVVAITLARGEVDQVVKATPERVRRNITAALASIDELESHGGVLARRADELSVYLATVDGKTARAEAVEHATKARNTPDPAARADYEAAAKAAQERARAIDDIVKTRDRTLAHLAKIAATIKAVPSKLVRLRALDAEAQGALTGDVGAELDRMNIDLRAFEQTLESIVEVQT